MLRFVADPETDPLPKPRFEGTGQSECVLPRFRPERDVFARLTLRQNAGEISTQLW